MIWCPYIPDDIDDSSATESSSSDNACRMLVLTNDEKVYEPRHEKTNVLHMRKQRRRSASR